MASFKADQLFHAHVDDDPNDPNYRESSDEDDVESDVPESMHRDRAYWMVENVDALGELYSLFKRDGEKLFGSAFLQMCDINVFCKFVYKYTTPGGV